MPEGADWSLATWEGSRKRQHQEFHALSFREKLKVFEEMDEVTRALREQPGALKSPAVSSPTRDHTRRGQ